MKYLVTWAWEMDGHAGASSMVLTSMQSVEEYIKQCLTDEGRPMGYIKKTLPVNDGYVYYGEWDCGEFSISIRRFKNFTSMVGKESFARTG